MTVAVADAPVRPPRAPGNARPVLLSPAQAMALPLSCALVLLAFLFYQPVRENARLVAAFVGAAAAVAVCAGGLFVKAQRADRRLSLLIALRPQHYLQACAHASILIYWGWYWREVYGSAHLIAAQIVFAYAVDMLLAWSTRDEYSLGFGPFPIVFSTNLFLWFRDDWFFLQFLMLAVGLAGKALITWNRDGRRAHIFNPSAFALTVASVALLATGTTDLTWGREIAVTQFYPPHMYLFLFLVGLPGQFLFGVTSMTMAAVLTTYAIGVAYFAVTGTYFFFDSYIPIAVFLGMHLLFTDPSTSPRTELGRLIFGALYGATVVVLYALLARFGMPTFYDKLLQVPLLNLAIRQIDRVARSPGLRAIRVDAIAPHVTGRRRHLAYMSMWAVAFCLMTVVHGVGDDHPGQWLPFWQGACAAGRGGACDYVAQLETTLCRAGSGWACNELGIARAEIDGGHIAAVAAWERGCDLKFGAACTNLAHSDQLDVGWATASPPASEYAILVRGSKGPVTMQSAASLQARACAVGWRSACPHASTTSSALQ